MKFVSELAKLAASPALAPCAISTSFRVCSFGRTSSWRTSPVAKSVSKVPLDFVVMFGSMSIDSSILVFKEEVVSSSEAVENKDSTLAFFTRECSDERVDGSEDPPACLNVCSLTGGSARLERVWLQGTRLKGLPSTITLARMRFGRLCVPSLMLSFKNNVFGIMITIGLAIPYGLLPISPYRNRELSYARWIRTHSLTVVSGERGKVCWCQGLYAQVK